MFKSLITLSLFLMGSIALYGQCDERIKPIQNKELRYQSRGEYCEGLYVSKVSAQDLTLVSCTQGYFRFEDKADEIIKVKANTSESAYILQAVGIPTGLYYQLDANLPAEETFSWKANTVLLQQPETKKPSNIGLLCTNGAIGLKQLYYPAQISTAYKGDIEGKIRLTFISSAALSKVKWKVIGQTETTYYRDGKSVRARQPFALSLPEDLPEGRVVQIM